MPVPVMLAVAAVRDELNISVRDAARMFGIAHSFLQHTEEFEFVPDPYYISEHSEEKPLFPLSKAIEEFFVSSLSRLSAPLSCAVKNILARRVDFALINDSVLHELLSSALLAKIFVVPPYPYIYGPLFSTLLVLFFERRDDTVYLRATNCEVTDYFLNFVMERFWSPNALRRRKSARRLGFYYVSGDSDSKYLGRFQQCLDEREIFLQSYGAVTKKPVLSHLFLSLLLDSVTLDFSFRTAENFSGEGERVKLSVSESLGFLFPENCPLSPDSSGCSCPSLTLRAPHGHKIVFRWFPEIASDFHCIRVCSC
ncbi:hypothetical protein [Desulfovirgula thermocuniculi]|uniref:hypothetical protein n=1 Tax=Desulfovirgula thermocuniculi TaxID=348842 RepID=UPI0004899D35|nr:hypothetical protein [Desulfovirgula thermocuniculi]